jgi:hypothetical protein
MNLHEAANTWDIALFIIKNKGYKVSAVFGNNDELIFWKGIKDNKNVSGSDPLTLLGLINIAEEYGEHWNKINTGKLYDKILDDDTLCEYGET